MFLALMIESVMKWVYCSISNSVDGVVGAEAADLFERFLK